MAKDTGLLTQIGAAITTIVGPLAAYVTDQKFLIGVTVAVILGCIGWTVWKYFERRRDAS